MPVAPVFQSAWSGGAAQFDPQWAEPIGVEADFDTANIDPSSVAITDETGRAPVVTVEAGRADTDNWIHFLFRLTGAQDKKPDIRLLSDRSFTWNFDASWRPLFSYDFQSWAAAPSFTEATYYEWSFSDPFTQSTVYVASHPTVQQAGSDALAADLLARSEVSPTGSADASGVIGTTPSETNNLGTQVGGNSIYGLKIDWGGATTDGERKRVLCIQNGMHPGEIPDYYQFKGMLDWMLDDVSQAAQDFRANWVVYAYFDMIPNGRVGGHRRHNFRSSREGNRDWADSEFILEESVIVRDAMIADMSLGGSGFLDVFIGSHGAGGTSSPDLIWYEAANGPLDKRDAFQTAIASVSGQSVADLGDVANTSAPYYTVDKWGAQLAIDMEAQMRGFPDVATYEQSGGYFPQAIQSMDAQGLWVSGGATTGTIAQSLQAFTQSAQAEVSFDASITQSLQAFIQSASATAGEAVDGSIAQSLQAFTQSASATISLDAQITQSLKAFTQSASAETSLDASIVQSLQAFDQSAQAEISLDALISQSLQAFTQSASAATSLDAQITQSLEAFTQSASASVEGATTGTIVQSLEAFTQSASAEISLDALIAHSLQAFIQSASATTSLDALIAQTLQPFTQSAQVSYIAFAADIAQRLEAFAQSASAEISVDALLSQSLAPFAQSAAATSTEDLAASIAQSLKAFTQSASAEISYETLISQTLAPFRQVGTVLIGEGVVLPSRLSSQDVSIRYSARNTAVLRSIRRV